MKLLVKILLFVFVALVTNVEVVNASIAFPNIQQTTTTLSFYGKPPKIVVGVIENNLANCCKNDCYSVDYTSGV